MISRPQTEKERANTPHLSYQLAIASTQAAGVALLLVVSLMIVIEFFTLRANLIDSTRVKAALLADTLASDTRFEDQRVSADALRSLRVSPIVLRAAVVDLNAGILATYPPDLTGLAQTPTAYEVEAQRFSLSELEIRTPIQHEGQTIGQLYLAVSTSPIYKQLGLFALISLGIASLAMILTYTLLSRARQSVRFAEQKLHHLAHVDPVTGLANRHAFNERLEFALREAGQFFEPVAVLLLDLDNFKQVNDTLGHQAGDELLRIIAQRIAKTMRRDDVVARLGGDEFAVILRNLPSRDEIEPICRKLVDIFALPTTVDGHDFFVTASIGLAAFPEHGEDSMTLTRNADTAMYQAKQSGKNAFQIFEAEMNASVIKRVSMEACLRNALQNGELSLHYQPKVDLVCRRLLGFEALLRWNSPQLGLVSPADFIPLAEDTGLIVPIGEWVMTQAMSDLRLWNSGRKDKLHVAVNLSTRQLKVDGITQRIAQLIAKCAIPAEWLELELTESIVMENIHAQIETFHDLRHLGVRIAIDDFGTGYSSMSYLKRLPIDTLKIDSSFVGELPGNSNDLAIATAIIALGHSLGLTVVAEGVETEAQAWALRELGCNIGQGYLFARPMPPDQVQAYLERHARATKAV